MPLLARWTLRALLVATIAVLALAGWRHWPDAASAERDASAWRAALDDERSPTVLVVAHRGGWPPENSLSAIEHAIRIGSAVVEIDVRVSRDGVPVLMHDATVDRTTRGTGAVAALDAATLTALEHRKSARGERVPTLAAALALARGRVLLDLDIKAGPMAPIVDDVVRAGALGEVLFFAPEPALDEVIARAPEALLLPRARSAADVERLLARFPRAPALHVSPQFLDAPLADRIRAAGARVLVRGGSRADALAHLDLGLGYGAMLDAGATMLMSDNPQVLLAQLRAAGRDLPAAPSR